MLIAQAIVPPAPIELWNQYDAAGEGVAQTTNRVEGWYYGLQECFSGSTPLGF